MDLIGVIKSKYVKMAQRIPNEFTKVMSNHFDVIRLK